MKVTDKKSAVLQATLELITTQGFHATPMSQIAKHAKVAAGTIYHHFASKEEMIEALYGVLKEEMGKAMLDGDFSDEIPYKEKFFKTWFHLYQFFTQNPMEFKFLEQYANSPNISRQTKDQNIVHYQYVIDFLEEGIKQQVLRNMPVDLMVHLVYGHITTVAKLQVNQELKITDQYLKLAIQSSWDGVKA